MIKKTPNRYDSLSPRWMRITRDILGGIGIPLTTYLMSFPIPTNTENIIAATIAFLTPTFVLACAIWKNDYSKDDQIQ